MKRSIIILLLSVFSAFALSATELSIILNDGSVVQGELISVKKDSLLLSIDKKASEINKKDIKEVYNKADGEAYSIDSDKKESKAVPKSEEKAAKVNKTEDGKKDIAKKQFLMFVNGTLGVGAFASKPFTTVKVDLASAQFAAGGMSFDDYEASYGFGIGLEYFPDPSFSLTLDGMYNTSESLLVEANSYAYGGWIYEMSGYTDARVDMTKYDFDTKFYMDTTFMRIGGKYYLFSDSAFRPWAGLAAGIFAWQATIGNREAEKKFSDCSGSVFGYNLLAGIDFVGDLGAGDTFVLRLYADLMSPVDALRFEDLLFPGWTFEVVAEHVVAPYRFGASIGMSF